MYAIRLYGSRQKNNLFRTLFCFMHIVQLEHILFTLFIVPDQRFAETIDVDIVRIKYLIFYRKC